MSLPHRAVLAILLPEGVRVLLTRLVVGSGVHMTEVVSGINRCTIHMDIYANVLVVRITKYPTLIRPVVARHFCWGVLFEEM